MKYLLIHSLVVEIFFVIIFMLFIKFLYYNMYFKYKRVNLRFEKKGFLCFHFHVILCHQVSNLKSLLKIAKIYHI